MPKRTREEKLAAYSKGAKRGYRARKRFVAATVKQSLTVPEMKEPQPGKAEAQIGDPGGIATLRALGKAGSGDAAQDLQDVKQCNAMVAQPMELSTGS
jgi:hypothetical protein